MNQHPIRILFVSDDGDLYSRVCEYLERARRSKFIVERSTSHDRALEALAGDRYDVCLLHDECGTGDGVDFLSAAQERSPQLPIIVLTDHPENVTIVEVAGVEEYLARDEVSAPLLELAVLQAIERKRSKRRTRLQSAALRAAANVVVITDRDGTIVWVNPAFSHLTGYSAQEAIGQNPRFLKSGKQGEAFYRDLWQTILAGHVWEGEIVNRRKDGSLYAERQTITPVRDERGEISHFVSIKYDITEWKETEAALHKSEVLRRLAVEGAGLGTWSMNLATGEAHLDARAREIMGSAADEPTTVETIFDKVHPEDREKTELAFETILNSTPANGYTIEQRVIHPDGSVHWVATMGRVQFRGEGEQRNATQIVGVLMDVTERKQAEEKLLLETARAETLAQAADRLNAQLDVDAVLQAVMEEVVTALDVPAAAVTLYEEATEEFYWAADYGLPPAYRQREIRYPRELLTGLAEENSLSRAIADLREYSQLPSFDLHVEADVRSSAAAIIQREGRNIGTLMVFSIGHRRDFTEHELALLQGVADQAAQAISNARLYQQAQQRLRRLQALNAIDRAITARMDMEEALDVVLDQVVDTLGADGATIFLYDSETGIMSFAACRGFRGDTIRQAQIQMGQGYGGRAASERRIIHIPDLAEAENLLYAEIVEEEGFVSYLGAPLVTEDKIVGILSLLHRGPFQPDEDWLAFLETVALQAAVVIDHRRLFTETQRLLRQTQEQAEQIQQILDTVPEGVILLDKRHCIVLTNPVGQGYLEQLGDAVEAGEVLRRLGGKPLDHFLSSVAPGGLWHELQPEGLAKSFEVGARQLQEGPQAGGWVLVLLDVTKERQQQAYAEAQQRLAAVGELAAGISHDFNNIMAVIVLYAQMLQRKYNETAEDRRALDIIYTQAQHASRLTRQILDFSRRSASERRPMSLIPLLKEQERLLIRTLPENIALDLQYDDEQYVVNADPTQVQQLMMNLSINARDAMPEGGKLTVGVSSLNLRDDEQPPLPKMEAGRWLQLAISDTGVGIPDEVLPRLFEPFFTTKAPNKGTGLGLAQVYGIVKQHEGHITVESRPGRGMTFTIFLPLLESARSEDPSGESDPILRSQSREVTVVLAEDERAARLAITEVLEELGMQVIALEDGQAALDWFDQNPEAEVDIVLSDMVMPKVGGSRLYRSLREKRPELKMILMSGYPLAEEGRDLPEWGALHWMQKPFTIEEIAERISAVLDE